MAQRIYLERGSAFGTDYNHYYLVLRDSSWDTIEVSTPEEVNLLNHAGAQVVRGGSDSVFQQELNGTTGNIGESRDAYLADGHVEPSTGEVVYTYILPFHRDPKDVTATLMEKSVITITVTVY